MSSSAVKTMFKMLTKAIRELKNSVSALKLQVELFAALKFDVISETAVVEFVKMSNFLLTEYEFLYNGTHSSSKRENMSFDLLSTRLTTLEQSADKKQNKLDLMDNELKLISYELHESCITKIRNKITQFRLFVKHFDLMSINYTPHEIASDISTFYTKSVTYDSKIFDISSMMAEFNFGKILQIHAWHDKQSVVYKKRRELSSNESVRKKSKSSTHTPSQKSSNHDHDKSDIGKNHSDFNYATEHDDMQSESKIQPVSNEKTQSVAKSIKKVNKPAFDKFIEQYNFTNTDILDQSSFQENEMKLAIAAAQLFREEKCNEERQRAFVIHILSLFAEMKVSFLEFFILLERSIQRIKKEEMDLLDADGLKNNTLRDSLQRRARKFVSSHGKMIFDFLMEFKSCKTTPEKAQVLTKLWPLSELSNEFLNDVSNVITSLVEMLYAEDQLLVCLSAEGFLSYRSDLYLALQDETVRQLYISDEKDKCILQIQSLVSPTISASLKKTSFVNNLWNLVGEYHKSDLPKAGSREIPWELRKLKQRSLEDTDSKTSGKKKRIRKTISKPLDSIEDTITEKPIKKINSVTETDVDILSDSISCSKSEDPHYPVTETDEVKLMSDSISCSKSVDPHYSVTGTDEVKLSDSISCSKSEDPHYYSVTETDEVKLSDSISCSRSEDPHYSVTGCDTSTVDLMDVDIKNKSSGEVVRKIEQYDSCDENGDEIQDCAFLDTTDFESIPIDDFPSMNEVLSALLGHLSIEEIWENIDDLWANNNLVLVGDLTNEKCYNTVTPAPNYKISTGTEKDLTIHSNCNQLSFISPNKEKQTAICTPSENDCGKCLSAINQLAKDFGNLYKHADTDIQYSFFWNLQHDLNISVQNNFEEFFTINNGEYESLLAFVNTNIQQLNFFHCIFTCESEYVFTLMDSRTFCLHVWAKPIVFTNGDKQIQSFLENFRKFLATVDVSREVSFRKSFYDETDRSDVCSFITLLGHFYSVHEGKNIVEDTSLKKYQIRNTLKKMVDADKLPTIDEFFNVFKS